MIRWIPIVIFAGFLHTQAAWAQRSKALPDHATFQHAGSIGFVSAGFGYQLSRKTALTIHYGFVPKSRGGELNIVAGKILYNTYSFRISRNLTFDPFRAGLMLSYHFGREFRTRWPSYRYPEGYYWWKTSLRAHLVTQTSLTFQLEGKRVHSVTGYIEFNTNELYFISYLKNRHALSLADIIKAGYGVRINF